MDKETLRKEAVTRRMNMPDTLRKQKSELIIHTLNSLMVFQSAQNLLAYYSHGAEVDTLGSLPEWDMKKDLYLPRLTEENSFKAMKYGELTPNKFGIPEPTGDQEAGTLDLILVPGVAFDREGNRLGMGKGYYDRFLSGQKGVLRVALAFSEQILANIPKESYDETVDMIITDEEIIRPIK